MMNDRSRESLKPEGSDSWMEIKIDKDDGMRDIWGFIISSIVIVREKCGLSLYIVGIHDFINLIEIIVECK